MKHDARKGWCICGERHDGSIPKAAPRLKVAKTESALRRDVRTSAPRKDKPEAAGRTPMRGESEEGGAPEPLPPEFGYDFGMPRL